MTLREIQGQIEKLPRRKEYLGGQLTSYVQLDSVLACLASPDEAPYRPVQRLRDEASLRQPNWDSYGSAPVTDAALEAAEQLYRRFEAVPTVGGGVQLEVHSHGWDIEIEVGPDGQPAGAYFQGPPPDEAPSETDQEPIAWKAVYSFHGTIIGSLHDTHQQAMKVLDAKRGPEYSQHEVIALCKVPPVAESRDAAPDEAPRGWQDIETAPKDGTYLLLFDGAVVSFGGWVSAADQGAEPGEEDLIAAGWWSIDLRDNKPTHWQPLPTPPRSLTTGE